MTAQNKPAATALVHAIDTLSLEERDRNQFIDRFFQAGRNLVLADEAIRSAALTALHRHYDPPPLPRGPMPRSRPPVATRDDDLRAALAHLQQNHLDRRLPVTGRVRHFWAMAMASRDLASDDELTAAFMRLVERSGLVADLGRHGREDAEHVLNWALRGLNPFVKGAPK
jgi:hypothetical protein